MKTKFSKEFDKKINPDSPPKWYAISVIAGKENDVKKECLTNVDLKIIDSISMESDVQAEDLSGYVFLKMQMNFKKYGIVSNTDSVLNFIGSAYHRNNVCINIPTVISEHDVNKIRNSAVVEETVKKSKRKIKVGDDVIIKTGDLSSIRGKVVEVKIRKLKIMPESCLGKAITVALKNVEKIM